MATSPALEESPVLSEVKPAKMPLVPLILAMVTAVFVSVASMGGAMFYLVHSGRLPIQKGLLVEAKPSASAPPPAAHSMVLESMVANLMDAGGATYLKMALTLRIADDPLAKGAAAKEEKPGKGISDSEAAVRDTVLTVVGRQTADELLAPGGKEHLKSQLKAALAERNPELKVMDLYFTDFLVQR
jgi:flagellar FliL protein